MVVLCPNCGREIFSDPDSCVMCGWSRDAPQRPPEREPRTAPQRGRRPQRGPPPQQRPPPRQYPDEGYEREYRQPPPRQNMYRQPQQRRYAERPRAQYPEREDYYQGRQRQQPQRRDYREKYERRRAYPQQPRRDQRAYYQDDRRRDYQERRPRQGPPQRYDMPPDRRPPPQDGRNYCPNCGREILTDPDNCVLCGWSRTFDDRRTDYNEPRRAYPVARPSGYQERAYQGRRDLEYRRDTARRGPPEGWERRVEERMRGGRPPQKEDRRTWYRPEREKRDLKKEGTKDRFICENCGNPSLQFFADGLGRCPGCGFRFRFTTRPTTIRSKQKHKQFICSNCDGKNLQFFLDGTGLCPQCKREFRWKK